ncbi:C2 family cysteine protease [Streptomyces asoensis]|uniref:C2 family cysteine protease n=1 Tax=Streptomyces asoensis TaxID=249586 RepID=UPI003716507E
MSELYASETGPDTETRDAPSQAELRRHRLDAGDAFGAPEEPGLPEKPDAREELEGLEGPEEPEEPGEPGESDGPMDAGEPNDVVESEALEGNAEPDDSSGSEVSFERAGRPEDSAETVPSAEPDRESDFGCPGARDGDDLPTTESASLPDLVGTRETDAEADPESQSEGPQVRSDEAPATGQFMDRVKSVLGGGDRVREVSETVDKPDFHLPGRKYAPDVYGTPLDGPDGTRTSLFDGVPNRRQTQQGALGDCGVIATMGAVAEHRPQDIMDRVKENEDGTYEVSLHEAKSVGSGRFEPTGAIVKLTVTPDLPVYSEIPNTPAFADSTVTGVAWAPIMEKAVAGIDQTWGEQKEASWQATHSRMDELPTGYTRLNFGTKSGERAELLVQLTGLPAQVWDLPTGYDHNGRSARIQFREDIGEKLADGCPVIVATRRLEKGETPLPGRLIDGHAYELTGIDDKGRFELRNPYNSGDPKPLTFDQLKGSILPNYVTLEKK